MLTLIFRKKCWSKTYRTNPRVLHHQLGNYSRTVPSSRTLVARLYSASFYSTFSTPVIRCGKSGDTYLSSHSIERDEVKLHDENNERPSIPISSRRLSSLSMVCILRLQSMVRILLLSVVSTRQLGLTLKIPSHF